MASTRLLRHHLRVTGANIRPSWAILAVGLVSGGLMASLVPPGLPYDEPSHWSVVLFIAHHARLPVLGHPGVTYEAQQGPLAYVIAAIVTSASHILTGSYRVSFYSVRVLGGIEFMAAAFACKAILSYLSPSRVGRTSAVVYLVCAPMFVAMGWSVQNDALFLALGFACLLASLRWQADMSLGRSLALGVLAGLSLDTKLSAYPIVLAIPLWLMIFARSRRVARPFVYTLGVAVASGWWFARNAELYHRLLPPTTLGGGPSFPPSGLHDATQVRILIEQVVTYLWLPNEYYRNTISSPGAVKALVVASSAAILGLGLAGLASLLRNDQDSGGLPSGLVVSRTCCHHRDRDMDSDPRPR